MAALVPTMDQVLDAVVVALAAMSPALPGVVYHHEDRLPNEFEAMRPLVDATSGQGDVWWVDAQRRPFQGPATDELYGLYDVTIRYSCVRADQEDEWSRQARFNLERVSTAIENVDSIFAISAQPLYTSKTTQHDGAFDRSEGTKGWKGKVTFVVEARRWS